ncbi:MAG: uroporphyrinogen decarboxylase family protein [Candidatus Promineifilaceae bacterium]|nr:uroporphyrinogen decarboxylase family protein [Candidatus Promineifilaceae bacterium]
MNSKERVLATLNRQQTDRTPLDCWLYQRQFLDKLEAEYGPREKFFDEYNIDITIGFVPYPNQLGHKIDVSDLADVDLGDAHDPKWLTFQDWNPDFAGMNVQQAVAQYGDKRAVIAHIWGIVEGTSTLLGISECWTALAESRDLMAAWFDRYADWLGDLIDSCVDAGVDVITLSDDWGSNQNMLFSPRMWRRLIKPYAQRVIDRVTSRGVPVNLHSDGYIMQIMDDLVEMGFRMMHPVQESAGMDPQTIKDKYGEQLVLYGSLDVIDGLLAYDGEELDRYIEDRFAIYGPGGGFIFNTGHFVQPDIPPQRLLRAYTTANACAVKYGS